MKAVTLVDREQTRVIAADYARSDRTLWQLLFARPRFGTLVLERAALDLERKADGTINLYEALKPILRNDPRLDLRIVVDRGRLRFRSAGLPEPVVADRANVTLALAASPRPLTWRVELAQGADAGRGGTLLLEGRYDRWGKGPKDALDIELRADAQSWPLAFDQAGMSVRGRLHGKLSVERHDGRWASTADARLSALDVSGPRLGEDQLRLDELKGVWDVAETAGAWDVRKLDVTSPLGVLHARGTPAGSSRVEGTLDVAALARQLPHLLGLREGLVVRKGAAELSVTGRNEAAGQVWDVQARLSDLHAKDETTQRDLTLKSPATFSGRVVRRGDALSLERLALASAFLNVEGQGELDRGVVLNGTFDLEALQGQLDGLMDFGRVRLSGRGGLSGRYRHTGGRYESTLDTELHGLRIEGAGPATLERDAARVTVTLAGAATATGLPASWTALRAAVASGPVEAELTGAGDGKATVWNGSAHAPLRLGDRAQDARAVFSARNDGTSLALERVELSLRPEAGEPIVVRAKGAFDRSDGTLTLLPLEPEARPRAVRLARDGVRIRGLGSAQAFRAEFGFDGDVARLSRVFAPESHLGGAWSARATAVSKDEGVQIAARLEARGLAEDVEGPVMLALDVLVPQGARGVEVSEFTLSSAYATVESSGRLSDEGGRRTVELRGTVTPGWDALNRLSVRRIDPRASLAGKPGKLALKADVSDLSFDAVRRSVEGELGFELTSANLFGMRVGRAPIGLTAGGGKLRVVPIDTTINEGRLHLEPTLVLEGKDAPALRLGPESSVRDAAINDEVSHRVLAFVAPVLESATRVRGRVSVALEDAEFPIGGGKDRHAEVDGTVTFQDVEFVAGALVDDLMAMIGREPRMGIKLNKPVALVIADGRVQTEGLALPLGNVSEIALDGWVDFDRHLRMTASLPVTRKMVLDVGFLGDIVEGTKISVPIGGTLDHPQVDRDALKLGLKDLGKTLLERTAGRGAAELLMRLARPRDPDAPPRLTPEQRRERRMERRMRRDGLVPPGG
jgi:translocation and assembly module TamB